MPTSSLVRSFQEQIIVLWFGSLASIPDGFALCDGTQGTPDLRNRFVRGAGDSFNPDDTGGDMSHEHTFTSDSHNHGIIGGTALTTGFFRNLQTDSKTVTGTTEPVTLAAPHKSLAYIMEL